MRTHRPHTKSRNGCITCKSRKVKCDERLPICTNCELRSTPCFYRKGVTHVAESRANSETSEGELLHSSEDLTRSWPIRLPCSQFFSPLPKAPPCNASGLAHSLLLSEYCQHASVGIATASRTDRRREIYCEVIPSLGFRHLVVSEAILAVATLSLCITQLRQLSSTTTASYQSSNILSRADFDNLSHPFLHQARIHHAKSLRALQDVVSSLCKRNTDAALACSALLIPYELAYSQLVRYRKQLPDERYDSLHSEICQQSLHCRSCHQDKTEPLDLTWLHLLRGLTTLMATSLDLSLLQQSTMLPLFQWVGDEGIIKGPFVPFSPVPEIRSWSHYEEGTTVLGHHLLSTILSSGLRTLDVLQHKLQAMRSSQATSRFSRAQTPQHVEICLEALRGLKVSAQNFTASAATARSQPFLRMLIEWIPPTKRRFLDLLAQHHTLALAVYAHFAAYMILLEDMWFIGDLGIGTLRSILPVVYGCALCGRPADRASEELQELFAWPARIARLYDDGDLCCAFSERSSMGL